MLSRLLLAAALAIAAAGSAPAVIPNHQATTLTDPRNETIIEKKQAGPVAQPIIVDTCATKECQKIAI
jgi:hypothetical protein